GSRREPSMKTGMSVVLSVVVLAAIAGHPFASARGPEHAPADVELRQDRGAHSSRAQTPAAQSAARPATPADPTHAALLAKYCATCHNERLKTAGLALDGMDL